MSKFTAGPWTHREAISHPPKQHVLRASGGHLCSLEGKDREANARLIAAAPELYAAIHAILEDAGYLSGEALPQLRELNVSRSKLDNARAALKKARGEQ